MSEIRVASIIQRNRVFSFNTSRLCRAEIYFPSNIAADAIGEACH